MPECSLSPKSYSLFQKEFENTSGVHASSRKPTKKCAMKMKVETKEKTMGA